MESGSPLLYAYSVGTLRKGRVFIFYFFSNSCFRKHPIHIILYIRIYIYWRTVVVDIVTIKTESFGLAPQKLWLDFERPEDFRNLVADECFFLLLGYHIHVIDDDALYWYVIYTIVLRTLFILEDPR